MHPAQLNGQDFSDFSKYLGFRHEWKTPLNTQAMAEAEQFVRIGSEEALSNGQTVGIKFQAGVYRFLRA